MTAARRLGLLEAMGRGLASWRANWPVALASACGSLLAIALVVAALAPAFVILGLSAGDLVALFAGDDPASAAQRLRGLDLAAPGGAAWLGALLAALGGATLASLVALWFQGGLLGVLAAADAQAPPGPHRPAIAFRTFSGALFAGEARRLFGRLLVYWTLVLGLFLVWLALVATLALGAALAAGRGGEGAALAIGCGGAIPLVFVLFVLGLGATFGLADLPRPDGTARQALAQGFRVLGDRLGASLGLWSLFLAASLAVATFDGGVGLAAERALAGSSSAQAAVLAARIVFQTVAGAFLSAALYASAIALVRGERAVREAPAEPPR